MGQKVSPVGMRLGINGEWHSKWYATNKEFALFLHEDLLIRRFLEARLKDAGISHIDISRKKTEKGYEVRVQLFVARPGVVLGQEGSNINKIRKEMMRFVKSGRLYLETVQVTNPDLDATLIANWIAGELENRASYRATQKKAIRRIKKAGAKGCRTLCSGRLGGAEIARSEGYKDGVVPLHTLRADIDFAHVDAHTTYGRVGVKVWICKNLDKAEEDNPQPQQAPRRQ